jgi:alpha-beta hydrolase superfamily lysophospholipase
LYYRVFSPAVVPKAAIIVVHGHGDHSGGLQKVCERLVGREYIAYAFDLRGHGKSPGVRGFIRKWEEYRGDLHEFHKLVSHEQPGLPLIMVGHSLGSVICLDYSLFHGKDLKALVAISPAISYELTVSEKILVSLMGKIKPDFKVDKPGSLELLTRDPEIIERLSTDPLRHNVVTPGLGRGLYESLKRIMNEAQSLKTPLLLLYGNDDKITPPEKLREFFAIVGSNDKQKFEYDSVRHRPFDDVGREVFYYDLITWLDQRIIALESKVGI